MNKAAMLWPLAFACMAAAAQNAPVATAPASPFICGGVGNEDQQRMKAEAPRHAAMLTFAATSGAYLADVDVQIRNSKGAVVVSGRCDGPIMLVDLPAGSWQVTASYNGQARAKTITTGRARPAQATFVWPVEKS